jgi:hypothetical protein
MGGLKNACLKVFVAKLMPYDTRAVPVGTPVSPNLQSVFAYSMTIVARKVANM